MENIWTVIVIALVLWIVGQVYLRAKKKSPRSSGARKPIQRAVHVDEPFRWPSIGDFMFSVVGESHYQEALRRLAGDHGKTRASVRCLAEVIPVDDNEHDAMAVEVRINGQLVGFMQRQDARAFRRRLGQKKLNGQRTYCDALVVGGGTRRSGEVLSYGVQLDLKPFDR